MEYKFDQIAFNSTAKKLPEESDRQHYIGLEHLDTNSLFVSRWGSDVTPVGEKLLMKKGDVLFGKRRAYQRKVGIAPFDGIFSAHGMVLRPKENVMDKDFFPFFISSDQFMERAVRISVGGLSPTINWKDLKEQVFEIPSLEEQKALAAKLWAAYKLREDYKRLLTATDEMVKSRFIAWSSEWKNHATIRDLVETSVEKASRKCKPEDTIRYIDISSIDGESNSVIGTTEYRFSEAPSRAQQCTKKGDILVSTVRPNLKNIAVNQLDAENLVASSGFCVLRPKDKYAGLILAYVMSEPFTKKMVAEAKGSNYPAIHDSDILDYSITVPESHELARVDAFVRQSDKSKFNDFKSRFIAECHSCYPKQNLGEHISVIRGVSYKPTDVRNASDDETVIILRSNNIADGEINYDDLVYVTQDRVQDVQRLQSGDIVMCGSNGSINLVGKAGLLKKASPNTSFGAFCLGIKCKTSILPEYLNTYFNTPIYRNVIESMGNGTNIINIRPDNITSLSIPIPPIEEQKEFVNIVRQSDKSKYLS